MKQNPVTLTPDSANYLLNFQRGDDDFTITLDKKPRYTASAVEILEKMAEQKGKN